jgi:hypothetical protein
MIFNRKEDLHIMAEVIVRTAFIAAGCGFFLFLFTILLEKLEAPEIMQTIIFISLCTCIAIVVLSFISLLFSIGIGLIELPEKG